MNTVPTPLDGACIIELDRKGDARGYFSRVYCANEFKDLGLPNVIAQVNRSMSKEKHTLRGLHYQLPPHEEAKTVICTQGAILDVFVDLRQSSDTFLKHHSVAVSAHEPRLVHVPKGFAHGFMTLERDTEVVYLVDEPYSSDSERGLRWDDPALGIDWPAEPVVISERDAAHPDFSIEHHLPHEAST